MQYVVDENVLVVANGDSHATDDCLEACIDFLVACQDASALVLDDAREMLGKYAAHCNHSGQPGVGDLFFVWARDAAATLPSVSLPKTGNDYDDFPDDPGLAKFDDDDRIWVAGALTAGSHLVNAVDSDYSHFAAPLQNAGLTVRELCPDHLKPAR